MARLLNIVYITNIVALGAMYFILIQLYSHPTEYSDLSTATTQDKVWYVSEAVMYAIFAAAFALMNFVIIRIADSWKFLHPLNSWIFLGTFFVIRIICELIWVTTNISINNKYMAITLFSCLLSSNICTAFFPYLRRILKQGV